MGISKDILYTMYYIKIQNNFTFLTVKFNDYYFYIDFLEGNPFFNMELSFFCFMDIEIRDWMNAYSLLHKHKISTT